MPIEIDEEVELERLNQLTKKRLDDIEARQVEWAARAAYRQLMTEKRIAAILQLTGTIVVGVGICAALGTLTYLEVVPMWLGTPIAFVAAIVASFKSGSLCKEMEGYR